MKKIIYKGVDQTAPATPGLFNTLNASICLILQATGRWKGQGTNFTHIEGFSEIVFVEPFSIASFIVQTSTRILRIAKLVPAKSGIVWTIFLSSMQLWIHKKRNWESTIFACLHYWTVFLLPLVKFIKVIAAYMKQINKTISFPYFF